MHLNIQVLNAGSMFYIQHITMHYAMHIPHVWTLIVTEFLRL